MIQDRSLVKIADNSGGQIGRVFKVLGSSKKRYAELGDEVVLSIQSAQPRKAVKKKDIPGGWRQVLQKEGPAGFAKAIRKMTGLRPGQIKKKQ